MTTVAIEDVTVIPMDRDRHLSNQTVVVRDDRIVAIGPRESARVPDDAVRVAGAGRFLMPGLAELHGHVDSEADISVALAFGVTFVRNLEGGPHTLRLRDAVVRGEIVGPLIDTVGPVVDGPITMRQWVVPVADRADAERVVDRVQRSGYSAVKIYDHLTRAGYDGILDAASARSFPVVGHIPFRSGLEQALRKGQRCIEHGYGYVEACQPKGSPLRELTVKPSAARMALSKAAPVDPDDPRIDELVALTKAAGTWNALTMMIRRRHLQSVEELEARPEMRFVDRETREYWRVFKQTYPYDLAHKGHELAVMHALVRKLTAAGAGVMAGTDAPEHFLVHGAALHEEIVEMRLAGLTPFQALQTATTNGARFFGQEKEWGVVAMGARADLLLLDADPLADVTNTRRIAGVVVRGQWFDAATLLDRAGDAAERSAWRPTGTAAATDGKAARSFVVSWRGKDHGTERVREDASASGQQIRWDAELDGFILLASGRYHYEADVAENRVARAKFSSETIDGLERVSIERNGDRFEVQRDDPILGSSRESHAVGDAELVGRASTPVFQLLARKLHDLPVGGTQTVELFGPGKPPDYEFDRTMLHCWRVEPEKHARRYSFRAVRPNVTYAGILHCDERGTLVEELIIRLPSELGNQVILEPPTVNGTDHVVVVRMQR